MGIPYLFSELVKQNGNIIKNYIKNCNRLFLDFNSIIHCCSAKITSNNPNYTNNDIFEEIIKYTLMLNNICKPSDLLYIGIDGVAPRAKINQQRKRRYISAYRNNSIDLFKKNNNIPIIDWDSNCITPGTEFMKELDLYIKNYFDKYKLQIPVIISSHTDVGEGEHKIIKYIKNDQNKSNIDIIYGLDADLIILSLCCDMSNIYLMRENMTEKQVYFKYLDINMLSNHILRNFKNIKDYICICVLIGNDFLPSISFIRLDNDGLNILCNIYKKIYNILNEDLILENKGIYYVNQKFLLRIFEHLSDIETQSMIDILEYFNTLTFNFNKKYQTKMEKYINEFENMPIINKYPNVINPSNDLNWKNYYYYNLFKLNSSNLIKDVSIKYIEGIVWNINYYFNNKIDENWYYQYNYSPCTSDIYKYLYSMNNEYLISLQKKLSKNESSIIINSDIQMLMVLPPQSQKFVPDRYRNLYNKIENGCRHLFPDKFKLITFLKTKTWECVPDLPIIDIELLVKYMNI